MPNISINTNSFPIQDYVTIDGYDSPGRAVIRSAATPRKWDERKGYGASGAWLVFMGNGLTEFEIDIYLWDRDNDPQAWADFAGAVLKKAPNGKRDKAHTIAHPLLTWPPLEISQCVIKDVTQAEQDETGGWAITIKCQEYRAPVALVVKNTDTPDVPNAPPKPADAGEQQIAALSAQRDALSSGSDKSGLF